MSTVEINRDKNKLQQVSVQLIVQASLVMRVDSEPVKVTVRFCADKALRNVT